ncbi:MAG TPA: hypothetical protein VE262_07280 [Blastocatellia bacterium]|nr:hypothetical protein [Blastocatellia bacterium]
MTDELTTKPTIETVLERINALDQRMEQRIDSFDQRMEQRVDSFDQRMEQRIDALDQKWDGRINALEQKLEARIDGVEKQVTALRSDMDAGLKKVGRTIAALNDNFLNLQSDFRDFNSRLERLESKAS